MWSRHENQTIYVFIYLAIEQTDRISGFSMLFMQVFILNKFSA